MTHLRSPSILILTIMMFITSSYQQQQEDKEDKNENTTTTVNTKMDCKGGHPLATSVCLPRGYNLGEVPTIPITVMTTFEINNIREINDKKMTTTFEFGTVMATTCAVQPQMPCWAWGGADTTITHTSLQ